MNVIGFDDGAFRRDHRGDVWLVGAVCSGTRLDGVVTGRVRRDGADATRRIAELVERSRFSVHLRAIMLQGIAVGGFNVVDIQELCARLDMPVLVVLRRLPDRDAVRRALFSGAPSERPPVRGAARKWRRLARAGPIEPLGVSGRAMRRARPTGLGGAGPRLWVQRAGLSIAEAREIVAGTTLHGHIPEPVRLAHLIAGGISRGCSRGRP